MNKKVNNINGNIEIINIPPLFLVIGIAKDHEPNKLRRIYNNPSYYFLDFFNPKKKSINEEGRFIHCDFNNENELKIIAEKFKDKFNLVFFDNSVFKFIDNKLYLKYFLKIIKKDGYLIIPDYNLMYRIPNGMKLFEYSSLAIKERNKIKKKQAIDTRNGLLERLKNLEFNVEIIQIKDLIIKFDNIFRNIYNNSPGKANEESFGFIIKKNN
jgi:hypothetical protein